MFTCSLMGHLGRQRGWHEALKRRCASRSHKNFSILLASVNCRNGKTRRSFSTRLLTHHQPQNLHGSWISSPCIPKISSLYRVSAVGVGSTPTADTVRSSRYYCSASRPLATPRKPTVKPTFVVQNGPTKGKKNKEGALKSEPSRRTQSSETGDIQESKLVLARKQRRKYVAEIQSWEREFWDRAPKLKVELGADIHSLRKEITKRANRLLIPFIAVRQSYTEKIEYLRAERISRYPARWVMDMLLDIDLHIIDIRGDLITIEEAVRERIRSLIDLFKEKLAMGETKIARLTKKKSDLEFPLGFQRRERDRTAWWDSIEIAFDTEKNVNLQGVRTFAKITTNVSRDRKDLEAWFMEYNVQISDFRLENENQHHVRDRLYRIAAIVQEVLDNGTHIKYYAHFARTYRRIYLYSSFDHSVSDYELRYVSLDMLASKLRRGGRILKAHTLSHSAMFRGIKPDETTSRSLIVPTRLTDLGSMLADNAVDFTLLSSAFYFGVLSNERSPDIQLRRAQAAALEPFREVADNMLGFLTAIDYASEPIESKDTIDLLESYHTRLKYSWRRIREDITVFGVANWRSNEHRLSKRTVFLKPLQSQSSCLLSPVTFNVPPGYPTTSDFNYNDYRGPQGEKVQIFYCSDVDSMDSALAKLQHNGIVSIDVRWAPGKTTRGAYYTDWFGRDVSVLTVSTQSEIVVCHLAMCRNPRHKRNIPNPLIQLLEDATVIKVGLDVGRIRERFISYLSISMQPICDLAYLHRAVQMCSSTGAEYPTSNDFKYKYLMKRYYHKSPIAVSARQGMFWLTRPLLLDLQAVATEAYACLRLFFTMSKIMLDMNSERLIPIHECSNQTVRNLGPLFPTTSINDRTITRDNVQLSAAKEGKDTAPSAQSQYEEFGPLRMRPASSSLLRDWSLSLADRILKVRPELSPVSSSLRLYCLWRTLECSCQDIENTLPQHKSNLPAMILTIIDDFDLPYEPEAYEELQKMALLQFEAGVKLENLEEKIQMSYLKQLPPAILSKRIDSLMAFIRGETKAKKWIKALAKKDKGKNSAEPYQDLLPFAMWYAAKASVENIVRLLLQSKSQVAASILKGASRLHPQRKFSKEELEGLAQMADNPPPWVGEQLSKMTVKAEPTSQKSKAKKVAKSKKQHTKALESPAAVSSRPIQDDGEMSTKVDLQSSNNKKQNTILESSGAFSSGSTQNDEEMSTEVDVQSSSHKAHHIVGSLIRRVAMIGKSVVRTVNSVTGSESQFLNTPLSNESLTKQQTPSPITTSSSIQKTKKKVGVATPETTSSLGTAPPTAEGKEKKIHTPSSHDHPKKNRVALTHSKRAEQGTEKKRRAEKTIKAAPSMTIPPESSFASVIAAGSVEARRKKNRDPSHQRKAKETMIKYIRREFGKSMQGKRVAEAGDGGGE